MIVREATPTDALAVAGLTGELGYPAELATIAQRLARLIAQPNDLLVVAVVDGQIAGWLQAHAAEVLESGFRVEIVGLIVGTRHRRRGVGARLVARAEQWAKQRGASSVVVRSNTQRTESHQFYPALGYGHVKTQSVYRKTW